MRRIIVIGLLLLLAFGAGCDGERPNAAGTLRATLHGHRGGVVGLTFSPDGRTLAVAAVGGEVRLWDASRGRLLAELPGKSTLLDLAFGPDGRTFVTAAEDGSVSLWDVERRSLVGRLRGHRGWVLDVAFGDDETRLATAGDYYYGDGTIRVWDTGALKLLAKSGRCDAVAMWFGTDGQTLAFLNAAGEVHEYDVVREPCPRVPASFDTGYTEYGNGVASPDRSKLVLVNEAGELLLWDVAHRPPRNLRLHARTYQDWGGDPVAFAPDGRTFASVSTYSQSYTAGKIQSVVLWDVASRAPRGMPLRFRNGGVTSIAFSPDGQTLAVGGADGTVRFNSLAG